MTFILSSPAAAPASPASPTSRVPARSSDQDTSQPGSFGDAMARSREASQEKAAEPAVRPAPSKHVRRLADADKATAHSDLADSHVKRARLPDLGDRGADERALAHCSNPGLPHQRPPSQAKSVYNPDHMVVNWLINQEVSW